ncbi:hypothetical protein HYH03_003922 [Edaphochlamys debaryana]|uniref:Uncharacterized protein n=1 Tax=Edaphochlamys debaryana TaxID=47281 RepID=A0A835Y8D0_9CHLO|nr:hypothetical protein HYH03_003922 [Edaphochlamys debaryana]|eukprot:KAG2498165.1 hypothetical protein HYH03_003922 [Edaphochlamys debaryana]
MEAVGVSVRDARRVVQVLVPGVPPPVLDFVFASITKSGSSRRVAGARRGDGNAAEPLYPSVPKLRRCESGKFGLSLMDTWTASESSRGSQSSSDGLGALTFAYEPATATASPARR